MRLSYSSTIAVPKIREFTAFNSFGFIGDFQTIGNLNLVPTTFQNIDLRWEWFPDQKELLSAGVFYKHLTNPIAPVPVIEGSNDDLLFQYQNLSDGWIFAVEIEARKKLDFIGSWAKHLRLIWSGTYTFSQIRMDSANLALSRASNGNKQAYRRSYKAPNLLITTALIYDNPDIGLNININFNYVGQKLLFTSLGATPDILEKPISMLNFSIAKTIGKNFRMQLVIENILDTKIQQTYQFNNKSYSYRSYQLGRTFSINLSYRLK